jgi:CubicO group peptidase (beta-lactamase class C family)
MNEWSPRPSGHQVTVDPVRTQSVVRARGEFWWTGGVSNTFWVDRTNAVAVVFLSQQKGVRRRNPGTRQNFVTDLRVAVNAAMDNEQLPLQPARALPAAASPFHRL